MTPAAHSIALRHPAFPVPLRREDLIAWYRQARDRTHLLFQIPIDEAYYDRPIPLRNPIVFYEGHLPAFCVNTLIKRGLGQKGVDERLEILFARGIDPEDESSVGGPSSGWPTRAEVQSYARAADNLIERALAEQEWEQSEPVYTILEHELMHQETLLYMLHQLPYARKRDPGGIVSGTGGDPAPKAAAGAQQTITIPAGRATLGAPRASAGFGWDNEFEEHRVDVPSFAIDRYNVTNGQYLAYMQATGAAAPQFWVREDEGWYWRGMFALLRLPQDWPVYVTYEEAEAYARWKGRRLMQEGEYHRAAFGTPSGVERSFPWGESAPDPSRGNFDFQRWEPVSAGSHPAGASAWGVHDLIGNGWEWTASIFQPFPGFGPMVSYPEYSADFFDDQHRVLKGASPVTARTLLRRSFRNWFRPNYPYVYAKFRLAG